MGLGSDDQDGGGFSLSLSGISGPFSTWGGAGPSAPTAGGGLPPLPGPAAGTGAGAGAGAGATIEPAWRAPWSGQEREEQHQHQHPFLAGKAWEDEGDSATAAEAIALQQSPA